MRGFLVSALATIALGAGAIAACSKEEGVTPVVQQIDDAGGPADAGGDAEPPEKTETTFACGGTTCNVGQHACCVVGTAHACFDIANGCPIDDAGADADAAPPPPLLCATYNNCNFGEECCYHPDTGSRCMNGCPSGYENLCRLGIDGCGSGSDCKKFDTPPLPNTGFCD